MTCATSDELYNFDFTGSLTLPNTHDVGLVILDQAIELSEYGDLAVAGSLDPLATQRGRQDLTFTVSGYGLTYKQQEHNGKPNVSFRERLMALSHLVNLNSAFNAGFNLQTNGNGTGQGGTCNGDSGGPVFYGGYTRTPSSLSRRSASTRSVVATTSPTGPIPQAVIDWILAIVGEEEFGKIQFTTI